MAATTLDRNTLKRGPIRQRGKIPIATGQKIPLGVIVSVVTAASAGAINATDASVQTVMGISCQAVDQTLGDTDIIVEQGIFLLGNNGSITAANIGQQCTVVDNQTVGLAADTTSDNVGGIIEGVESGGVWVNMTMAKIGAT